MKILSFLLLFLINSAAAITYEYMDQLCGTDIDVGLWDSVRLQLTQRSVYKSNMNCYIRVKTDSGSRIMLYFKSFNVESGTSCSSDWLEVRDGRYSSSPYVSGLYGKQCGFYMSSSVYKTSGNYLYLRFVSDGSGQYSGFDMVITSYHTGICYSYEYSCTNGRCISDSITCNGYNPCGDYSDCNYVIAGGTIAGIVVGSFFFVVFVTVLVIIFRRRRIAYVGTQIHQPVNAITTTTGYNQPVHHPYPQQYPQQNPQPYTVQPPPQYPGGQYPNY